MYVSWKFLIADVYAFIHKVTCLTEFNQFPLIVINDIVGLISTTLRYFLFTKFYLLKNNFLLCFGFMHFYYFFLNLYSRSLKILDSMFKFFFFFYTFKVHFKLSAQSL